MKPSGATPLGAPGQFGPVLHSHRVAAGLTQAELAERAGLSARAISDLERGVRRFPYPATVRRLARSLGLSKTDRSVLLATREPARVSDVSVVVPADPAAGGALSGRIAAPAPLSNLPNQLSSFVGREREITAVRELLETTRLVTLTGAGGVGKTRLALNVAAAELSGNPDGVWLVELAALADPSLVVRAAAAALGVREQPGRPVLATLAVSLQRKCLMLVLDNCEHLIEACSELAEFLLQVCPGCRLLITSREPLRVAGEATWRVPSLSLPDMRQTPLVEHLAQSEAVQLFVERARAASRGFALVESNAPAVAQLCQRLDGIPLALELAAARVTVLSVDQIAARLDDHFSLLTAGRRNAPARQQTLRATVEWSYALLSEAEQVIFEQLSVFAGGWTIEAVEAVCTPVEIGAQRSRNTPGDVLDLLSRLVNKSLVMTELAGTEARYRLLEMLRQYAHERLQMRGSALATRRRHAQYFLVLVERAEGELTGPSQAAWLDRLEVEHDNLRGVLRWAIESGEIEHGLRLAWVMWRFWWVRGYLSEGRQRLAELLELARVVGPRPAVARGLVSAGLLATWQADYSAARCYLQDALDIAQPLGELAAAAYALAFLNRVARDQGDEAQARALGTKAVALFRGLDDRWGLAISLHFLGLASESENVLMARSLFEESADIFRQLGSTSDLAMPLRGLGDVAYLEGDAVKAERLYDQSASLFQERGDEWSVAMLNHGLGDAALAQHDPARAWVHFMKSLASWRTLGHHRGTVLCLAGFASVLAEQGRFVLATRMLGATEAACARDGVALEPTTRSACEAAAIHVRAQMSAPRFGKAWADGRGTELDDALAMALQATGVPPIDSISRGRLTKREREVARLIADGLTNRQIAQQLVISERTVDRHVENILRKLDYASRTQIASWVTDKDGYGYAPFRG